MIPENRRLDQRPSSEHSSVLIMSPTLIGASSYFFRRTLTTSVEPSQSRYSVSLGFLYLPKSLISYMNVHNLVSLIFRRNLSLISWNILRPQTNSIESLPSVVLSLTKDHFFKIHSWSVWLCCQSPFSSLDQRPSSEHSSVLIMSPTHRRIESED